MIFRIPNRREALVLDNPQNELSVDLLHKRIGCNSRPEVEFR